MKAESRFNKKQKSNLKSDSNTNSKKIILNKKEDLNKISFTDLKNAKIFDFSGDFFNFIYQKAINLEKNPEEKENLMIFNDSENNNININEANGKIKKKIKKIKKKDKEDIDENINYNNNIKLYNFKENNKSFNDNINNNKVSIQKKQINKEFKPKKIIFQMKYNTQPGEDLGVIGSISELGSWDQNRALRMKWNDGNIWKSQINYDFNMSQEFEFKFIFIENGHVKKWEDGNNRKLN